MKLPRRLHAACGPQVGKPWSKYILPPFASKVITSYSSNWIMLLLLCTSAPLVLCCDQFDHGSRQVKGDPVDLLTVNYDINVKFVTLRWPILNLKFSPITNELGVGS